MNYLFPYSTPSLITRCHPLPVCVLVCRFSSDGRSNFLPQTSHGSQVFSLLLAGYCCIPRAGLCPRDPPGGDTNPMDGSDGGEVKEGGEKAKEEAGEDMLPSASRGLSTLSEEFWNQKKITNIRYHSFEPAVFTEFIPCFSFALVKLQPVTHKKDSLICMFQLDEIIHS